jgi:hypothetical protein
VLELITIMFQFQHPMRANRVIPKVTPDNSDRRELKPASESAEVRGSHTARPDESPHAGPDRFGVLQISCAVQIRNSNAEIMNL